MYMGNIREKIFLRGSVIMWRNLKGYVVLFKNIYMYSILFRFEYTNIHLLYHQYYSGLEIYSGLRATIKSLGDHIRQESIVK